MVETYPLLIGGVKTPTKEILKVRFPYTGEVCAEVCQAGNAELKSAVTAACRGFEKTRALSSHARAQILFRIADEIHRRADELADVLVMEGGKTRKFAASEVARAEMTVRLSAEEVKRIYGEIIPLDLSEDTEGRTGFVQRFPLGPVVGIVPFNFPLNLACHKLAPAIAAGNSIILKPASTTPVSSLILGDITRCCRPPPGSDQRGALHGCPGRAARPRPPRCLSLVHRAAAPWAGTSARSQAGHGWASSSAGMRQ